MTFLDTNVFIYAAGRDSEYKASCVRVLADVVRGDLHAAISSEVCQEVLYVYHRPGRGELATEVVQRILAMPLTILPVGKAEIELAIAFYRQKASAGLLPRDAVHAAVMERNGIGKIISTDAHFDLLDPFERIDPRSYAAGG